MSVEVGQRWRRVIRSDLGEDRKHDPGVIEIEEVGLKQAEAGRLAPTQCRAVFVEGPREGQKVQWAENYVERYFELVPIERLDPSWSGKPIYD